MMPDIHYKADMMSVTPLLFWLSLLGAGPDLNSSNEPTSGAVLGQPLLVATFDESIRSIPLWDKAHERSNNDITKERQDGVIRAQSGPGFDDAPEFILADPCPRGIHRELAYELLDTFNPMSKTTVRVLPGYYDPFGWQASYGTNGYQTWRLGWSLFHEIATFAMAPVSGGTTGQMQITEWNSNLKLSELLAPGVLLNITGYFNARYWDGPGGIDLGPQVDQLSTDLELGFFNDGPWSAQIAFHPQIVDGYESRLNSYAFNFDGRAIATYMASPEWSFVGGVGIWDRVGVMVVPHAGVIWTPDTHWELRLLYPKSRISYYLGRKGKTDFWVYGTAEYVAEAWQADIGNPTVVADRIQLTDDRVSLGLRWDSGRHSIFVEGGYVFNRKATFAGPTPNFDISNTGMIRAGFRF